MVIQAHVRVLHRMELEPTRCSYALIVINPPLLRTQSHFPSVLGLEAVEIGAGCAVLESYDVGLLADFDGPFLRLVLVAAVLCCEHRRAAFGLVGEDHAEGHAGEVELFALFHLDGVCA